jgi:Flp pilus assembly protein TadB
VAQTKKKRRRKHSGTQAGTVSRQSRPSKPQTKEERRQEAQRRRTERLDRAPTLKGSIGRAAIAAVIFVGVVLLVLGNEPVQALAYGVFMFALYIPIGYFTDSFIYRRRQRKKREAAAGGGRSRGANADR